MFDTLPLLRSASQLRSRVRSWRAFGESVALAPMSGGVHEGHLSVIREARRRADRVLAAMFIDPIGFVPGGDQGDYTPDEADDLALLEDEGCDAVYAPAMSALLPAQHAINIQMDNLTSALCGRDDPGRYNGYIRLMVRLMNQAQADLLFFGERDWQRLAIIRTLANDLAVPTEIVAVPTEREADGVAVSAAARGLNGAARKTAARLYDVLRTAAREIEDGEAPEAALKQAGAALTKSGAEVEYAELRDAITLAEPTPGQEARIFAAIRVAGARLIDNAPVRLRV